MNKTQKGCCIAGGVLLLIGIILLGLISCSKIDWFFGDVSLRTWNYIRVCIVPFGT